MSPAAADDASRWICSGGPIEWPGQLPRSLSEALRWAIASGNRTIIHISQQGRISRRTYAELRHDALDVARRLRALGLEPGQTVLLQLRDPSQFLLALWGCLMADLVPAPMSVPPTYRGQAPAQRRLKDAWHLLDRPPILTDAAFAAEFAQLTHDDAQFPPPRNVFDLTELPAPAEPFELAEPLRGGDELAIILLTSGSTGEPKGVMLSHRNLLSMAAGTAQQNRLDHRDATLNWLPLDHVGAVSFLHFMPTLLGCRQVHVATDFVLRDLLVWIELLHQHRATISWAPNFAFRLISQQAGEIEGKSWDLSALRFLVNAGEAVVPDTVRAFWQQLEPFGLRLDAIRPAFGMSETCSGITWSPGMRLDQLEPTRRHVDLGPPIPGASLRIVDASNRPLPEGREGRLQIRGASLFLGYANRPELTRQAFTADGWFDTGDLGTLRDGRLIITGRAKEVIIINGVHYASQEIEAAVDALPEVATSYTAACAVRPPGSDTDRLAVFFSPAASNPRPTADQPAPDSSIRSARQSDAAEAAGTGRNRPADTAPQDERVARDNAADMSNVADEPNAVGKSDRDRQTAAGQGLATPALIDRVRRAVIDRVGIAPDFIIPLAPHEVPKTAIGKIQRSRLKERFERGEIRAPAIRPRRHHASPGSRSPSVGGASQTAPPAPATTGPSPLSPDQFPPKLQSAMSERPISTVRPAVADIQGQVIDLWQQVLQLEQIGPDDSFFELGGRSIDLPRLEAALKDRFGLDASSADLLAYPTPAALAQWIADRLAPEGPTTTAPTTPAASDTARSFAQPVRPVQAAQAHPAAAQRPTTDQAVAIVGMACRFPGADNVEQFWQNLREGRETIRFLDPQQLLAQGVPAEWLRDPHYVPAVPWLEGIDRFDAPFFGYDDQQAAMIDPQQRLFLQCAWHALEDSGTDPSRFPGRIGVFGSAGLNIYMNHAGIVPELADDFQQALTSGAVDFLATRTAYKLNLTGPSLTVQTACSSGLYAVHLACQSLANGECEMALAGGASIWALETRGYRYRPGGLASPDGHCRAFDANGRGMVFGNGVGLVVLKPLAAALRDGNPIHAVIRASAVNNDGALKAGFTTTGMQGQADVVARACERAGVDPATIGLVECHGTGTVLGDAIEIAGLTRAFRRWTNQRGYCAIGSVKTNIGHMGVACGIAGLIKATLAVEHGEIPPSLHFETPNPQIDFAGSPFYVSTRRLTWPEALRPRRAGVTSLGLGGANVHVVIEQPPEQSVAPSAKTRPEATSHAVSAGQRPLATSASGTPSVRPAASGSASLAPSSLSSASASSDPQLLVVSAKSPAALGRAANQLADFLQRSPHIELQHVAYTLQHGRQAMPYRVCIVVHSSADAAAALRQQAAELLEGVSANQASGAAPTSATASPTVTSTSTSAPSTASTFSASSVAPGTPAVAPSATSPESSATPAASAPSIAPGSPAVPYTPSGAAARGAAPIGAVALRPAVGRTRWVLALGSAMPLRSDGVADLYARQPLFQQAVDRLAARLHADFRQYIARRVQRHPERQHHNTAATPAMPLDHGGQHAGSSPSAGRHGNTSRTGAEPPQSDSFPTPDSSPADAVFLYALAQLWLQCIDEPPLAIAADDDPLVHAVVAALSGTGDLAAWINQRGTHTPATSTHADTPRPNWRQIARDRLPDFLASHGPCHVVELGTASPVEHTAAATPSPATSRSPKTPQPHQPPLVGANVRTAGATAIDRQPSSSAMHHAISVWLSLAHCSQAGLLEAIGRCWQAGLPVDWHAIRSGRPGRLVSLPGYPFEPRRCWIDRPSTSVAVAARANLDVPPPTAAASPARQSPLSSDLPEAAPSVASAPERRPRGWLRHRLAQQPPSEQLDDLLDCIIRAIAPLTAVADWRLVASAADTGFVELGMTSRSMTELIDRLAHALDQTLPSTLALECPTPRHLAVALHAQHVAAHARTARHGAAQPAAEAAARHAAEQTPPVEASDHPAAGHAAQAPPAGQSTPASSQPSNGQSARPATGVASSASGSRSGVSDSEAASVSPAGSIVDDIARLDEHEVLRALRELDHTEEPGP